MKVHFEKFLPSRKKTFCCSSDAGTIEKHDNEGVLSADNFVELVEAMLLHNLGMQSIPIGRVFALCSVAAQELVYFYGRFYSR